MAIGARSYKPLDGTLGEGVVVLAGSFVPNGTSAPTGVKGKGFTVAYTSTGTYTITLDQQYKALLSGNATVYAASASARYAQLGTSDVTTAKTVVIRTVDGSGSAAAVTNGDKISFVLWLSRSSLNT